MSSLVVIACSLLLLLSSPSAAAPAAVAKSDLEQAATAVAATAGDLANALTFSPEQIAYAASDVLNLHALRDRLDAMLVREGRDGLAKACFEFLPHRAALDLAGWEDNDIFAHT